MEEMQYNWKWNGNGIWLYRNCISGPAYQEKRNVVTVFDNLKNEHPIEVNKMSPNEIFMFLINLPNEKSENQKIDSEECVQRNEKEDKKSIKYVSVCMQLSLFVITFYV